MITLDAQQRAAFARELDALHEKYRAKVGAEDVAHLRRVDRLARRLVLLGRALIHLSADPFTWLAGVTSLWLGKQLRVAELGHTIMHGTYDRLDPAFSAERYAMDVPVEKAGWAYSHNVLHHGNPNVVGRDPDARFGTSRLNESTRWTRYHRVQLLEVAFNWLNTMHNLNAQVVGLIDLYVREAGDEDIVKDRSFATWLDAHWRFAKVTVPYVAKNYVFFPALAGPFWWKVLAGNLLAETMRNAFTAIAIYCGHVGEDVADFPEGHRVHGRAEWYLLQLAATHDFEVPYFVSVLLGALDKQVEHHLFPKLPPNRLRELAPELRAICEKYGVPVRTGPWPQVIRSMVRRIVRLSRPPPTPAEPLDARANVPAAA